MAGALQEGEGGAHAGAGAGAGGAALIHALQEASTEAEQARRQNIEVQQQVNREKIEMENRAAQQRMQVRAPRYTFPAGRTRG